MGVRDYSRRRLIEGGLLFEKIRYTAISRKVVGEKRARDNPKR